MREASSRLEAVQAEATYNQGLACICASPWLDQIMRERFGAWSRPFWLGVDRRTYNCTTEQLQQRCQRQQGDDQIFHVAVYARQFSVDDTETLVGLFITPTKRRYLKLSLRAWGITGAAGLPMCKVTF